MEQEENKPLAVKPNKNKTATFQCSICSRKFKRKDNLKAHEERRNCRSALNPFECRYCGQQFRHKGFWKRHEAMHGSGPVRCLACGVKFKVGSQLREHYQEKHEQPKFCLMCRKTFYHKEALILHVKSCKESPSLSKLEETQREVRASYTDDKNFFQSNICPICQRSCTDIAVSQWLLVRYKGTNIYACPSCAKSSSHGEKFSSFTSSDAPVSSCSACSESFRNKDQLIFHKVQAHDDKQAIQEMLKLSKSSKASALAEDKSKTCPMCQKEFPCPAKLRAHLAMHLGEKPFSCPTCQKSFTRKDNLKQHLLTHSSKKPYPCSLCSESFRRQSQLRFHKVHAHGAKIVLSDLRLQNSSKLPLPRKTRAPQTKRFLCHMCGNNFFSKSALKEHVYRIHLGRDKFHCEDCGRSFKQQSNLVVHMLVHLGITPYQCSKCQQSFTTSTQLRKHERSHAEEQPFSCSQCGRQFGEAHLLKMHMRTHTGDRPYSCPFCGKSFGHYSTLRTHKRIHTGDKPFKCNQCQMAFSQRSSLTYHLRSHRGERPYSCHICGKAYTRMATLNIHLTRHTGQKRVACPLCDFTCDTPKHLRKHAAKAHPGCDLKKLKSESKEQQSAPGTLSTNLVPENISNGVPDEISNDVLGEISNDVPGETSHESRIYPSDTRQDTSVHCGEIQANAQGPEHVPLLSPNQACSAQSHSGIFVQNAEGASNACLGLQANNYPAAGHLAFNRPLQESSMWNAHLSTNSTGAMLPAPEAQPIVDQAHLSTNSTRAMLPVPEAQPVVDQAQLRMVAAPYHYQYQQQEFQPSFSDTHRSYYFYEGNQVSTMFVKETLQRQPEMPPSHGMECRRGSESEYNTPSHLLNHEASFKTNTAISGSTGGGGVAQVGFSHKHPVYDTHETSIPELGEAFESVQSKTEEDTVDTKVAEEKQTKIDCSSGALLSAQIETASDIAPSKTMVDAVDRRIVEEKKNSDPSKLNCPIDRFMHKEGTPTVKREIVIENTTRKSPRVKEKAEAKTKKASEIPLSVILQGKEKKNTKSARMDKCGKRGRKPQKHMHVKKITKPVKLEVGEVEGSTGELKGRKSPTGPVSCPECGKTFTLAANLPKHMRLHTGERPYKCSICGCSFPRSDYLKNHLKSAHPHPDQAKLLCIQCGELFPDLVRLDAHLKQFHDGLYPFCCNVCSFSCLQLRDLKHHVKGMHQVGDDFRFQCALCFMVFPKTTELKAHVESSHKKSEQQGGIERAGNANVGEEESIKKEPQSIEDMDRDEESQSIEDIDRDKCPYKCGHCGALYSSINVLGQHMTKKHTGEKRFKCGVCHNSYLAAHMLARHMLSHSGERPRTCDKCGKAFADLAQLKKHLIVHTNSRPFLCKQCGQAFRHRNTLRTHERIHTGSKPFKCKTCDAAFAQRASLRYHERTHLGLKPYMCQICGNSYTRATTLNVHMNHHAGIRKLSCPLCEYMCDKPKLFHRHMAKAHPGQAAGPLSFTSAKQTPATSATGNGSWEPSPGNSQETELTQIKPVTQVCNETTQQQC